MSLRWRLTIAFVLVVVFPLLVGGVLVFKTLPRAVQQQQERGLTAAAQLTGKVLDSYCNRARSTAAWPTVCS